MGLPSIFEVYTLAIGPNSVYTTGALKIGQAFREILLASPYRPHHRLIIELLGNFADFGLENLSDQAVTAGIGGYALEDAKSRIPGFFQKIREQGAFAFMGEPWPFNPESDIIFNRTSKDYTHPNTIRFHLTNPDGQPVFQAEYQVTGNGIIRGPGIQPLTRFADLPAVESFMEVRNILDQEKIGLVEYILSGECSRFRFSPDQANKRMKATWKVMVNSLDHGLKTVGFLPDGSERQAQNLYKNYLRQIHQSPSLSPESARCGVYAAALAEEVLDNRLIISAPTCTGAGVLPAVFKVLQENYLLTEEKILEGLWVSGLVGAMILARINSRGNQLVWSQEVAASGIMTACGVAHIMGGSPAIVENAGILAADLFTGYRAKPSRMSSDLLIRYSSLVAQGASMLFDLARIQIPQTGGQLDASLDNLLSV